MLTDDRLIPTRYGLLEQCTGRRKGTFDLEYSRHRKYGLARIAIPITRTALRMCLALFIGPAWGSQGNHAKAGQLIGVRGLKAYLP